MGMGQWDRLSGGWMGVGLLSVVWLFSGWVRISGGCGLVDGCGLVGEGPVIQLVSQTWQSQTKLRGVGFLQLHVLQHTYLIC